MRFSRRRIEASCRDQIKLQRNDIQEVKSAIRKVLYDREFVVIEASKNGRNVVVIQSGILTGEDAANYLRACSISSCVHLVRGVGKNPYK